MESQTNPVDAFLKHASKTQVKGYIRSVHGKKTLVKPHSRTTDDDAKVEKAKASAERRERELKLWQAWKAGGMRKQDLAPLLSSFEPMLRYKASSYLGRVQQIPDEAILAEYKIQLVAAFRSYNPAKGSLSTYVYRYLDKSRRFISDNQNVARIPEHRIYKIGEYKKAVSDLMKEHDRIPTEKEIAKRLGWREVEVSRMDSELRDDLASSGFLEDPTSLTPSRDEETLRLFKYELSGTERVVYEHLTGFGRERIASTGKLAKKLGMRDYQVSRIRKSIEKKIRKYR